MLVVAPIRSLSNTEFNADWETVTGASVAALMVRSRSRTSASLVNTSFCTEVAPSLVTVTVNGPPTRTPLTR